MASGNRQPRKGAPNVGQGKRAWRTPIPHLSLFDRKVGQGLIVFKNPPPRKNEDDDYDEDQDEEPGDFEVPDEANPADVAEQHQEVQGGGDEDTYR